MLYKIHIHILAYPSKLYKLIIGLFIYILTFTGGKEEFPFMDKMRVMNAVKNANKQSTIKMLLAEIIWII
jgi:hypothetical protein